MSARHIDLSDVLDVRSDHHEFLASLVGTEYLHEDRLNNRSFKIFYDLDDGWTDLKLKHFIKSLYAFFEGVKVPKEYVVAFVFRNDKKDNYHIIFPWLHCKGINAAGFYNSGRHQFSGLDLAASCKGQLRMPLMGSHKGDDQGRYTLAVVLNSDGRAIDSAAFNFTRLFPSNWAVYRQRYYDLFGVSEKNVAEPFNNCLSDDSLGLMHYASLHYIFDGYDVCTTVDDTMVVVPDVDDVTIIADDVHTTCNPAQLLQIITQRNSEISQLSNNISYNIKPLASVKVISQEFAEEVRSRAAYMSVNEVRLAAVVVLNRYFISYFNEVIVNIDERLQFMTSQQLSAYLDPLKFEYGPPKSPHIFNMYKEWNRHAGRLSCTQYTFNPRVLGHNYEAQIFNSYNGLRHNLSQLSEHITVENRHVANAMQEHIFKTICNEELDSFHFFMMNIAVKLRRPWVKLANCVVLQGNQGAGKTIVGEWIGYMFHKFFYRCHDLNALLAGQFSGELLDRLFVLVDEAFLCDPRACNKFKAWITESHIALERKFKDKQVVENHMWFMLCTNEQKVLPPGEQERRFVIFKTRRNQREGNEEQYDQYWNTILKHKDNDYSGLKCWLSQFLDPNVISDARLDAFGEGRVLPENARCNIVDQKLLNLSVIGQFWNLVLQRGYLYTPMCDYAICDVNGDYVDQMSDEQLQKWTRNTMGREASHLINGHGFADRRALHKGPTCNGIVYWWLHWQCLELIFEEYMLCRRKHLISDDRYSPKNIDAFVVESKKYFEDTFAQENMITIRINEGYINASRTRYDFDNVPDEKWHQYLNEGQNSSIQCRLVRYVNVGALEQFRKKFSKNSGLTHQKQSHNFSEESFTRQLINHFN